MKQKITFFKVLLTLVLLCGVGNAWAADTWTRVTSVKELLDGGTFVLGYKGSAEGRIIPLRSADCDAKTTANGYFYTGTTAGNSTSGQIDINSATNWSDYELEISASTNTTEAVNIKIKDGFIGASSNGGSKNTGRLYTQGNSNETDLFPTYSTANGFSFTANVNGSYKYLKYNTSSPRFAFYSSEGNSIIIYKKGSTTPTTAYTVTFDSGTNGTCLTSSLTETSAGAGITLPSCTANPGYTFVGWSTNENPTSANAVPGTDGKYHPSSNCTLYAYYTANKYSITYKDQGGADFSGTYGSSNPTTHTYGTATTLVDPSKVHYTFGGWFTSSDCSGDAVTELGATAYTDNITLYAKWTEDPKYTVTFNVNDSQYGDVLSLYNGESIKFPTNNPSVDDVEFIGWVKEAITEKQDEKPTLVTTSTETMGEAHVTYYAVFATAEKTTFDASDISATPAVTEENLSWQDPYTGVKLHLSAGSRYISGTPNTFTVTSGTGNYFQITSSNNIDKIVANISESGYVINSVITGATLTTNSLVQTVTASDLKDIKCYATSNKQIRATSIDVYSYSDYCTTIIPLVKHTLTISSVENGTLTVKKGNTTLTNGAEVAEGAVITLTATPAEHYHFVDWTGTVDVDNYTFKMPTSDATIGVRFEEDTKYHITANVPEGGTYTVKVGDADAVPINEENDGFDTYAGTAITMTSTADETHKVHSDPFIVTYKDGTTSKKSSFEMPAQAVSITAQFVETYTITPGTCENGSITKIADNKGNEITRTSKGSTVVVSAKANEHYHLSGMYYVKEGDDKRNDITATDDVYSFSMVASNITVYAEFEEDENVSITWSINGKTDVIAASKVYVGDAIVFPTNVDDVYGNKFMGWVGESDKEYSNETTAPTYANASSVNATEDATYYAVFAKREGSSTDYEMTIGYSGLSTSGYASETKSIKATNVSYASDQLDIEFKTKDVMNQLSKIQFKASSGLLYNTTDLGSITSVTLNTTTGTAPTIYYGISQKPTSGTSVGTGNGYFAVKAGSAFGTAESITVNFTKSYYTYSNYSTKPSFEVTISSAGYATAFIPLNATISNEANDVKAYYVTVSGENAQLNEIEGTIPANKGVVLKGSAGTVTFTESAGNLANVEGNMLIGTADKDGAVFAEDNTTYYILSSVGGKVGFYWDPNSNYGDAAICAQYKAVLAVPNKSAGAPSFFTFDDATAINAISNVKTSAVRYNLNGQAVGEDYKGIVIVNGKKMFNK